MATSPDGARLATIVRDSKIPAPSYSRCFSWMVILNVGDGQPVREARQRGACYWRADWSADGSHLLLTADRFKPLRMALHNLVLVDVASGFVDTFYSALELGTKALWLLNASGVLFEITSLGEGGLWVYRLKEGEPQPL